MSFGSNGLGSSGLLAKPMLGGGVGVTYTGYDIIAVAGESLPRGTEGPIDLALDADPTGRIKQFAISGAGSGTIVPVDTGTIYHPNVGVSVEVGICMAAAKRYLQVHSASNRKVLIVPYCYGGHAFYGNGAGGQSGFNPYGAGPAYPMGSEMGIPADGSLYLGFIAAVNAAIVAADAEFGPGSSALSCLVISANAYDNGARYDVLLDRMKQFVIGCRAGITGGADVPVLMDSTVPEWSYSGIASRPTCDATRKALEEEIPYFAFVQLPVGGQSPTGGQEIHRSAAGNRIAGSRIMDALPLAQSRDTAVARPVDWLDDVGGTAFAAGLIRMASAYSTGNAFRLHNGSSEIDVPFLASGLPDWDAALDHAGGGSAYITRLYDQLGSGTYLSASGTGTMRIISSGALTFNAKRPSFGDNVTNVMLDLSGDEIPTTGAVWVLANFAAAGNKVLVASQADAPAIARSGGNVSHRVASAWNTATIEPAGNPAGISRYYQLHGWLATPSQLHVDGALVATTVGTGPTYAVDDHLTLGGKSDVTNRYAASSFAAVVWFDTAPVGEDLDTILGYSQLFSAKDSLEVGSAFSGAFSEVFH